MEPLKPQPSAKPTQGASQVSGKNRAPRHWHWHLFCQVIDNWGDIGVTWRLATDLAQRGQTVTVWLDDKRALAWMAPQGAPGVQVADWPSQANEAVWAAGGAHWPEAPTVVVEMFGCHLPTAVERHLADIAHAFQPHPLVWLNLEYLSAEPHVQGLHRLPSPVMSGPAAGLTKWFFYPGFRANTGGLIHPYREATGAHGAPNNSGDVCSLFCYPSPAIATWLSAWQTAGGCVAVWPGAGADAVRSMGVSGVECRRAVSQTEFDMHLRLSLFNVVRGEDSLAQALWSGRPLLWHIYPQSDGAHLDKLEAFLDWAEAPAVVRRAHHIWNGPFDQLEASQTDWVATPFSPDWPEWLAWAKRVREKAEAIPNLTLSLLDFVEERTA